MAFAWPELDYLAALYFALAVCFAVIVVVKVFFGVTSNTLGKLPVIGGWIDAEGRKIQQRVTNLFGGYAASLEGRIGSAWHGMARIVDWLGRTLHKHIGLIALALQNIPGLQAFGQVLKTLGILERRLHHAEQQTAGIGTDVLPRVKGVERGIGNDVLPRIRSLEREVNGEISRERVRARTAEHAIDREITNLWKWVRSHTKAIVEGVGVGAVAIALSRLGLGWLRCPSLGKLGRRIGCGGFALLDELLAASLTAFAVADLCTFANVAMDTAVLIRPALLGLVDVEDALVGCHGAEGVPPLEPVRLRLPDNSRNLPLAA